MDSLPLNLLLFPLVGGYYVTTRLEASKFISQRLSSQAIIFNAVLVSMPLMAISLLISTGLTYLFKSHVEWTKSNIFPIKDEFFGTCILSLIIAFMFTLIKNKFTNETKSIYKAIEKIGNELELLLTYSFQESKLIQLTLKNDKVYIGWAEVLPKPSQGSYIQIIPLFSGYRDTTKELIITTNYSLVYSELIQKGKIKNIQELKMNLVIQTNEILTASRFDFEIFESFVTSKKAN